MIRCIPEFFPDELVGSAYARMIDRLRVDSSTVFTLLFGLRYPRISWDLPRHLDHLSSVLPLAHPKDLYELLEGHTLFPFYRVFSKSIMRPTTRGHFERRHFLRDNKDECYLPAVLRYCPACAQEDRRRYGERYWHRVHQLPGVYLCSDHGTFLENTKLDLWSMSGSQCQRASAERVIRDERVRSIDHTKPEEVELLRIARVMVQLLDPQNALAMVRKEGRRQLEDWVIDAYHLSTGRSHLLPVHKRVIPPSFVGQEWTRNLA